MTRPITCSNSRHTLNSELPFVHDLKEFEHRDTLGTYTGESMPAIECERCSIDRYTRELFPLDPVRRDAELKRIADNRRAEKLARDLSREPSP